MERVENKPKHSRYVYAEEDGNGDSKVVLCKCVGPVKDLVVLVVTDSSVVVECGVVLQYTRVFGDLKFVSVLI